MEAFESTSRRVYVRGGLFVLKHTAVEAPIFWECVFVLAHFVELVDRPQGNGFIFVAVMVLSAVRAIHFRISLSVHAFQDSSSATVAVVALKNMRNHRFCSEGAPNRKPIPLYYGG